MAKFTDTLERYRKITVHHLQELCWDNNKSKHGGILSRLRKLRVNTTSMIFLFVTPQFLVFHFKRDALQVMLGTVDRCVLRTLVLDELHRSTFSTATPLGISNLDPQSAGFFFWPSMHPRPL